MNPHTSIHKQSGNWTSVPNPGSHFYPEDQVILPSVEGGSDDLQEGHHPLRVVASESSRDAHLVAPPFRHIEEMEPHARDPVRRWEPPTMQKLEFLRPRHHQGLTTSPGRPRLLQGHTNINKGEFHDRGVAKDHRPSTLHASEKFSVLQTNHVSLPFESLQVNTPHVLREQSPPLIESSSRPIYERNGSHFVRVTSPGLGVVRRSRRLMPVGDQRAPVDEDSYPQTRVAPLHGDRSSMHAGHPACSANNHDTRRHSFQLRSSQPQAVVAHGYPSPADHGQAFVDRMHNPQRTRFFEEDTVSTPGGSAGQLKSHHSEPRVPHHLAESDQNRLTGNIIQLKKAGNESRPIGDIVLLKRAGERLVYCQDQPSDLLTLMSHPDTDFARGHRKIKAALRAFLFDVSHL